MQPGPVPEDIDSILSRFHSWAERKPAANGNGSAQRNGGPPDEVREIAYEEAMREHLNRRASQNGKPAAPRKKTAARQASSPSPAPDPPVKEVAPVQEKKPPFVPSLELLAALRSAAAPEPRVASPPPEPLQPILFREDSDSATQTRPAPPAAAPVTASPSAASSSLTRAPTAKNPTPAPKTAAASAFRELLADASAATAGAAGAIAPKPRPRPKVPRQNAAVAAQRPAVAAPRAAPVRASIAASSRPQVKPAKAVQAAIHAKPAIAGTRRTATKAVTARRSDSISAAKRRKPRPAPFRQVLANTIQQPRLADAAAKKGMPDRTRRITTRFTTAEERRIEKQASLLGLTVSAYLRHCALATVTPPAEPAPPPTMLAARNKAPQRTAQSAYPPNPYAAQGSSLIGGWLALLRNRFLGPPIQFSDDA